MSFILLYYIISYPCTNVQVTNEQFIVPTVPIDIFSAQYISIYAGKTGSDAGYGVLGERQSCTISSASYDYSFRAHSSLIRLSAPLVSEENLKTPNLLHKVNFFPFFRDKSRIHHLISNQEQFRILVSPDKTVHCKPSL